MFAGLFPPTEIIYSKACPGCRNHLEIQVLKEAADRYRAGAHIQDAFPTMRPEDRERFISGYCGPCWDALWGEE